MTKFKNIHNKKHFTRQPEYWNSRVKSSHRKTPNSIEGGENILIYCFGWF